MKRRLTSLLIMAVLIITAFANDGVYYTSGNQLVPLKETDVSVKKEILTISILDNNLAKVDVYYEFFNPGSSTKSVTMGFEADPSYNDDYKFYASGVHPHIKNFTVEANGQVLSYKNAVCEMNDDMSAMKSGFLDTSKYKRDEENGALMHKNGKQGEDYVKFAYVYYFTMNFKPGKNIVHHTYQYTMSSSVGNAYEIGYKLSPAARWANHQIDDFTLIIRADNTAKHFYVLSESFGGTQFNVTEGTGKIRKSDVYASPCFEFSLRNGAVTLHKTNFCPDRNHELTISSADCNYTMNEEARFGEYYDRKYNYVTPEYRFISTDYVGTRKKPMTEALFKRVAKNLPYANRGHVFKDATLKKYFTSLWWYMPDPNYKDDTSDFTELDWEYVKAGK